MSSSSVSLSRRPGHRAFSPGHRRLVNKVNNVNRVHSVHSVHPATNKPTRAFPSPAGLLPIRLRTSTRQRERVKGEGPVFIGSPSLHHSTVFPTVPKLDITERPRPSGAPYRSLGGSTAEFVTPEARFVTPLLRICNACFLGKHGLVTL